MVSGLILLLSIQLLYNSFQLNKINESRTAIQGDLVQKSIELERSEFLLQESNKLAHVGGWEVFAPDMSISWTKEALTIFNLQNKPGTGFEEAVQVFSPDSRAHFKGEFRRALVEGKRFDLELKLVREGNEIWVRMIGQPIVAPDGEISSVRGIIQDIDDSKQKELMLRNSLEAMNKARQEVLQKEELYQTLVEHGTDLLALVDHEAQFTMVSANFYKVLGYKTGELILKSGFSFLHPDDVERVSVIFQALLSTGENQSTEFRFRKADGVYIWMEARAANYLHTPNIAAIAISLQDINLRVKRESELRTSRRQYKALFDNNPDMVYYEDKNGLIIKVNEAASNLLNQSVGQIERKYRSVDLNMDYESADGVAARETPVSFERRICLNNGESVLLDITRIPVVVDQEVIGVHTIAKDITTQRQFLQTIQSQAEDLQSLNEELLSQSEELQQQSDKVYMMNDKLQRQTEQEYVARKEAEMAESRAREANEAKSIFLATMSHEIRTPMNGVMGMSLLLAETSLNAEQRGYIQMITSSGEALLTVINDILDFSKIESGKMEIEHHDFDLRRCVQEVRDLFSAMAAEKCIALNVEICRDVPEQLSGDILRIRQILINLINNALKFTAKGEIKLTVGIENITREKVRLLFSVRDTGIGIPQDKLGGLFKAFTQVDPSTTRKYGGSGLGLAICERRVELMGGDMQVESKPGFGSIFSFSIKSQISRSTASGSPLKSPDYVFSKQFADEYPLRILIAEDNLINQKLAIRMLNKLGYDPHLAQNGREAVNMLLVKTYDLVLMDLLMPEMDGLEATREIRSTLRVQPQIVAMTASAFKEDREECMKAGMNAYISKPIPIEEFKSILKQAALSMVPGY